MTAVLAAILISVRQARKKGIATRRFIPWRCGHCRRHRRRPPLPRHRPVRLLRQPPDPDTSVPAGRTRYLGCHSRRRSCHHHICPHQTPPAGHAGGCPGPRLLIAQIIGRFGCIVNGDAYAGYHLPWLHLHESRCADSTGSLRRADPSYPVYEQIWNVMVLLVLWRLSSHIKRNGVLFFSYLSFYSGRRFLLTFVREERFGSGASRRPRLSPSLRCRLPRRDCLPAHQAERARRGC